MSATTATLGPRGTDAGADKDIESQVAPETQAAPDFRMDTADLAEFKKLQAMMAMMGNGLSKPNLFMPGSQGALEKKLALPAGALVCAPLLGCALLLLAGWYLFLAIYSVVVLVQDSQEDMRNQDWDMRDFSCPDYEAAETVWAWMVVWSASACTILFLVPCLNNVMFPKSDEETILKAIGMKTEESKGEKACNLVKNLLSLVVFVANCAMLHLVTNMPESCVTLMRDYAHRGEFWLEMEMIAYSFVAGLVLMGSVITLVCCVFCLKALE